MVFHGGEEYEIVFTTNKKNRPKIIQNASLLNTPVIEVGYVVKGNGVFIEKNEKFKLLKNLGWSHFKN